VNKLIQIDFDGVIHRASKGYQDGEIYDEPNTGACFTIKCLIDRGYEVEILTARNKKDFEMMERWLDKWEFPKLHITNTKKPARAYIDNRAIRFTNFEDMRTYFI
tara:strand:- start:1933 stop:2247 length:315 start_codon:yes stop_codon:yes gene_type:complete